MNIRFVKYIMFIIAVIGGNCYSMLSQYIGGSVSSSFGRMFSVGGGSSSFRSAFDPIGVRDPSVGIFPHLNVFSNQKQNGDESIMGHVMQKWDYPLLECPLDNCDNDLCQINIDHSQFKIQNTEDTQTTDMLSHEIPENIPKNIPIIDIDSPKDCHSCCDNGPDSFGKRYFGGLVTRSGGSGSGGAAVNIASAGNAIMTARAINNDNNIILVSNSTSNLQEGALVSRSLVWIVKNVPRYVASGCRMAYMVASNVVETVISAPLGRELAKVQRDLGEISKEGGFGSGIEEVKDAWKHLEDVVKKTVNGSNGNVALSKKNETSGTLDISSLNNITKKNSGASGNFSRILKILANKGFRFIFKLTWNIISVVIDHPIITIIGIIIEVFSGNLIKTFYLYMGYYIPLLFAFNSNPLEAVQMYQAPKNKLRSFVSQGMAKAGNAFAIVKILLGMVF